MKFVEKNHLTSLKLSKFTPSTAHQSAAHSDERLKSYCQKTAFFGQKQHFWGKIVKKWPQLLNRSSELAVDCCAVLVVNLDNFIDAK